MLSDGDPKQNSLLGIVIYLKSLVTKRDKRQGEKNRVTYAKRSTIDRQIQSHFHLFAKCDVGLPVLYHILQTNGSGIVFVLYYY